MQSELKPCDFCGSSDHLRVVTVGVMTSDMPDRPYRVVCSHIDHDDVQGPVAYGRAAAITAWNTRATDAEITRLTEALRAAEDREQGVREALAWYGEQARLARLIHSEGDAGLHALLDDGGLIARLALAGAKP